MAASIPNLPPFLDEIGGRRGLRSFLVTDTLAGLLRHRVDLVLPVARERADMLSMHTTTLGFPQNFLVGIAAARPDETLASLKALNEKRETLARKTSKRRADCSSRTIYDSQAL